MARLCVWVPRELEHVRSNGFVLCRQGNIRFLFRLFAILYHARMLGQVERSCPFHGMSCAHLWAPSELPGMQDIGRTVVVCVSSVFTPTFVWSIAMNMYVIAALTLPRLISRQDLRGYAWHGGKSTLCLISICSYQHELSWRCSSRVESPLS